ncbi:DUF1684 domain-containing protein [Streptomyces beigongshangae]|uniref:DUF1684 domain-containing protein n=1 Tax=Streptomyces beigongshangae TaxID=2841597 RepID=UPI0027E1AF65|nr:DUF1684 domain-containing protein [Streptomyces sp. REN17]
MPGAQGRTTGDFSRCLLPSHAFADHCVCPFPSPGNNLSADAEAGGRDLPWRDRTGASPARSTLAGHT